MDNNAKFKYARVILSRAMAIACSNGFNPNDPMIRQLLDDQRELNKFNLDVINKIIDIYSQVIEIGEI